MNTCHNNLKKSSTTKINKHTPSGYSLVTYCSFDTTKNKLDYYRGENCLKNFCTDLKEHATKIINYEKKRNETINKSRKKYIVSKKFVICVIVCHCHFTRKYRGAAHDICNLNLN